MEKASDSLTIKGVGRTYQLEVDYSEAENPTEEEMEGIVRALEHLGFFDGVVI